MTKDNPANWPAAKIEMVDAKTLIPYARNARTHSAAQVDQIAASIREWGWTTPILRDEDGNLIAGHGRLLAANKLGIKQVPVMTAKGWSEAQRRAYVLADNKLALNAGWDDSMLGLELAEISDLGFDLDLTGFSLDEIASFGPKTEGLTDPDETPEAPANPVSVLGDVWLLGNHRIVCGSSTDADTVAKCLNGVKPHLMVTDPPYGVNYDASWRDDRAGKTGETGTAKGRVLNDDRADWREAWALFPGDVAYVWHADLRAREVVESLEACDFLMRAQIIWAKSQLAMSRGHYHFQHEPCWYAVRKTGTGHWNGDRKQSTLWKIDKPQKSETGHSTQKPIECMQKPIENNSSPGQAIYEPFSGSGTTIIAGEITGRHVHAIELNPEYVDVAVIRWQNFTGKDAIHEATGKIFSEC
jgi:DNA modification methylase